MRITAFVGLILASVLPGCAQVVISQIYGAGGNSGAALQNDYVELFNRGTAPVSLAGWSVQYASATGTGNFGANTGQITLLPPATLQPGQYFLIQQAGGANGSPLPAPDFVDDTPISMAAGAGKLALVDTTEPLGCNGSSTPCSSSATAHIVDLVGYGTANYFEGTVGPSPTTVLAIFRADGGCTDRDDNGLDFATGTANPRNLSTTAHPCGGGGTLLSGTGAADPNSLTAASATLLTVAVAPATDPNSTGIAVQADLTAIGGSATQNFLDDGQNGDAAAGDNVFSFQATVDASISPGAKALPFGIADAQARSATGTIALTVTAPVTGTTISAVQGPGNTSPMAGETVRVTGIVTGVRGNSFYIQTEPGSEDGDPATSEGILVFTGSGNVPATAVVGNKLDVTGVVTEFVSSSFPSYTAPAGSATLTELVAPLSYSLVSTGNTLPAPQVIDESAWSATAGTALDRWSQLERFEGMRVTFSNFRVTQNTNDVTLFGTLASAATPYRELGVQANKLPVGTPGTVPVYDSNPEVIRIEGNGLNGGNATFDLPFGSTIATITGIVDYDTSNGVYSIRTNAAGVGAQTPANLSATPLPMPLPTDFTVGTINAENFSSTNTVKLAKISLAVRNILHAPDVLGFQEVNTLASLQAVAARIDSDAASEGQTPPNYTAALLPGNALGMVGTNNTQNVGFLYKASRLTGVGAPSQYGTEDNTYTNPVSGSTELTFDRPPLVISGTAKLSTSDSGIPFTVVVNHLKSLIDLDNNTNHPTDSGLRNQAKRHFGARDTGILLNQLSAGSHLVSVGDHNAYQFNDGYVDVLGCVRGTPPTAGEMIYQPPPGLACESLPPDNQLINLTDADPVNRYSYYFLGSRQTLDHIVVNQLANNRLRLYAASNLNADFPADGALAEDPSRPERITDHNPQVAYFTLPNEVTSQTAILSSGLIYNRSLGAFTGTITVKNMGTSTLSGPLHVFFHNLPAGVTVSNASGFAAGVPYLTVPATLAAGQSSTPVAVRFTTTPATRVTYGPKTYSVTF